MKRHVLFNLTFIILINTFIISLAHASLWDYISEYKVIGNSSQWNKVLENANGLTYIDITSVNDKKSFGGTLVLQADFKRADFDKTYFETILFKPAFSAFKYERLAVLDNKTNKFFPIVETSQSQNWVNFELGSNANVEMGAALASYLDFKYPVTLDEFNNNIKYALVADDGNGINRIFMNKQHVKSEITKDYQVIIHASYIAVDDKDIYYSKLDYKPLDNEKLEIFAIKFMPQTNQVLFAAGKQIWTKFDDSSIDNLIILCAETLNNNGNWDELRTKIENANNE